MILAAGLGTRLRPLTDTIPKALVEVGGVPMLEHVARRLIAAGATRLIINVHHHAEQVRAFVEARGGFGVETQLSVEPEAPLETGGGLLHAAPLFRKEAPFVMHNADILTDFDLRALLRAHAETGALATLAVRRRETPRYLVFDERGVLCGYGNATTGHEHLIIAPEDPERLSRFDFCGVQALSPRIFDLMTETGVFSIISVYLRLVRAGEQVRFFHIDGAQWIDIGQPEQLEAARRFLTGGEAACARNPGGACGAT